MNQFLVALAILAQLTGLTAPQIINEDLFILPSYSERNELELQARQVNHLPLVKQAKIPQAKGFDWGDINLSAKAAIAMDATTGQVLWQKNETAQVPIASLTKLMTALVFMDNNPGWEHKYKMRSDENYLIGAKLNIDTEQELTVNDLLRTTLVGSANNTAKALSRSTGMNDEQFALAMNEKAEILGLTNSVFVEPTGLEEGNKASVLDLAIIFRDFIGYEELKNVMGLEEHMLLIPPTDREHRVKSTVKLLKDDEVDVLGGKTGFTYEAGYCLITLSKNEQGNEVITAVMGLETENLRDQENKELIQWVFNNYNWK